MRHPIFLLLVVWISLLAGACAHEEKTASQEAAEAPFDRSFAAFDDNRNGKIDRAEYEMRMEEWFGYLETGPNGSGGVGLKGAPKWVRDTADSDGRVNIIEFMQAAEVRFDAADANHDGWLSRDEFRRLPLGR